MDGYTLLGLKLAMGIIGLVLQINLMGKGNLAPTSAMDQVQNYVLGGIIGGVIYSLSRARTLDIIDFYPSFYQKP